MYTQKTEEKIKETARKLFTLKGYSSTTIREIARDSQVNIALVNYYFRSKENLFKIIMEESFEKLFSLIEPIINNKDTALESKIQSLVNHYLDFLLQFPDLPLFMLNEIKNNPKHLGLKINIKKKIKQSSLILQIRQANPEINPLHIIFNLLGMLVFPFIMKPVISSVNLLKDEEFRLIIHERKKLIPAWIKFILKIELSDNILNYNEKS